MLSDGTDLTRASNAFQALAAATGKAWSLTVKWWVSLYRACRLMLRLEVRWTESATYASSPSCRHGFWKSLVSVLFIESGVGRWVCFGLVYWMLCKCQRRWIVSEFFQLLCLLQKVLAEHRYEYVLDRACIQFEPDDPQYIRVTQTFLSFIVFILYWYWHVRRGDANCMVLEFWWKVPNSTWWCSQ